ncbi:MAG: hypothetical protein QM744_09515 [Mesorhizobium sp.]
MQRAGETALTPRGTMNRELTARLIERHEERQTLDVVPVQVTQQKLRALLTASQQLVTQRTQASTRVEHEQTLTAAHLDRARVTADSRRGRPRRRNAAANTPKTNDELVHAPRRIQAAYQGSSPKKT